MTADTLRVGEKNLNMTYLGASWNNVEKLQVGTVGA
jgi:hypothetical protein